KAEERVKQLETENAEYREMLGPPGAEWSDLTWLRNQLAMTNDVVDEQRAEVERLRGQVAEDADAIRRLRTMYRAHGYDVLDDSNATESEKDSYLGALAVIDALPAVRRAIGGAG